VANPFVWFDLRTPRPDAARHFYSSSLDWEIAEDGAIGAGGEPFGVVADAPEARWLPYIQVEDLEEATRRAVELGAWVVQARIAGPAGHCGDHEAFRMLTEPWLGELRVRCARILGNQHDAGEPR
jgi:predicted enzyme related to lactoylglutathione lyase